MTDLERARQLLADDPDEMDETWLAEYIAAARREGAEEMREKAAELCDLEVPWLGLGEDIRALPLTPEEPT